MKRVLSIVGSLLGLLVLVGTDTPVNPNHPANGDPRTEAVTKPYTCPHTAATTSFSLPCSVGRELSRRAR